MIQKACHTPVGPRARQSSHASGMMKNTYRHREITSDSTPLPSPSNAPEEVVETAETRKPMQMIRRAVWPMAIVSGLVEKREISGSAANRQIRVPAAMMHALSTRVRLYSRETRLYSWAP